MEQTACNMLPPCSIATLQHCNIISVQHGTDNVQHAGALQPAAVVIGSACSLCAAMPHHTAPSCKTCRRRRSSRSVRCLPRVMVCVVCHVSWCALSATCHVYAAGLLCVVTRTSTVGLGIIVSRHFGSATLHQGPPAPRGTGPLLFGPAVTAPATPRLTYAHAHAHTHAGLRAWCASVEMSVVGAYSTPSVVCAAQQVWLESLGAYRCWCACMLVRGMWYVVCGVYCMLHVVCCMLRVVCCMLHGVCCMLRGVWCVQPGLCHGT